MYTINVIVRNQDNSNFSDGDKMKRFYHKTETTSEHFLHLNCKELYQKYTVIARSSKIEINVSYFSEISQTHPVMYEYVGNEDMFIKLT